MIIRNLVYPLLSAYCLLLTSLFAQEKILEVSSITQSPIYMTEYIQVFEDLNLSIDLTEITKPEFKNQFKKVKSSTEAFNFSYSTSAFWLRLQVENKSNYSLERIIEISYPRLETIQFYKEADNGYITVYSGYSTKLSSREHKSRFFAFPFFIPANTSLHIYLRITSPNSINIPIRMWEPKAFYLHERDDYTIQTFYFGLLFAMAFFNLLLYTILRDVNYLLYVFFVSFVGLSIAADGGIGSEVIWTDSIFMAKYGVNILISLTLIIFLIFMRRMLGTKNVIPRFDFIIKLFIGSQFILPLLFIISFKHFVKLIVLSHMITAGFIIIVGLISVFKKVRSAYFFLLAFTIFFLGLIVSILRAFGVLSTNPITLLGPQFGSAIEMMLLAFSLADRYNTLRKEKESAEALVKENLEKSNLELEQKVKERTATLDNTLNDLNQSLRIIRDDLSLAKKIQKNTLLIEPKLLQELNIIQTYIPMSEVGGDYYDVVKLNDSTYRIFQADATGHGVQAAMITMAIKGIYDNIKNFDLETLQIMEIFNNDYLGKYKSLGSLMTAILIDIDVKNHKLKYTSAGHPAAVLLKKDRMILLKNTGKMIGVLKNTIYKSLEFDFIRGDKLFVFTDGIFEEFNSKEEEFGEERLYSILEEDKNLPMELVIQNALKQVDSFLEGKEKQDDITILGIEYRG
jgi:serine phosphatase RsbU (regulator of sigma subunit)